MRNNFSSVPGLRFRSSLRIIVLGVLPFAAFIAEARAQTPDQPSSLPGFTIVYEQTTAASENGVKRLRGIHVRYQRSDCWAKEVIVKKGTRDVIEPVSILRGEPDEKILVRETSKGTQKKVDFTYGVLQGVAFKKVQPSYPAEANAAGVVGEVQVQILISETGTVIDAVPISGPPLLHAKALEAARQWVFKPTEISTETVKVQDTLRFNFAPQ